MKVDIDLIRELASILDETGLTEIEVTGNGQGLRISKGGGVTNVAAPAATAPTAPAPIVTSSSLPQGHDGDAITSPMVGTVYLAPQPGDPPFVQPGDNVSAGDTLLIIEAMKVMNPIQAPRSGTIKEILVDDSQPVEFGHPLVIFA